MFMGIFRTSELGVYVLFKTRARVLYQSDRSRTASVFNSFKNDPFYTHLVALFTKELSI